MTARPNPGLRSAKLEFSLPTGDLSDPFRSRPSPQFYGDLAEAAVEEVLSDARVQVADFGASTHG